ncbi:oxidoreductase, 2OG-Fe(II) oxygenase family protein [Marinomonas sp. MED121]|uniref:2OG-Fe(II) oxygenase n=1 Tax=Marinomonas sp. MED121 TaxID=314277 RepID=UPI000068FD25|nr:2OG-Fe(II) oxygenase [Marinomonas sp. MED121]EAQ63694.1 oxidoreductase, 2OG-Fe(II) oxygenase family protein [Marinomonas sp. MED121]
MQFDADITGFFQAEALTQLIEDIRLQGYSIQDNLLDENLVNRLQNEVESLDVSQMKLAGVGRKQDYQQEQDSRRDYICWLEDSHSAGRDFIQAMDLLKQILNRQFMLGLFDYESHYARYQAGGYYEKHLDAFTGKSNRVLSTVLYLNDNWQAEDAGEFVLFDEHDHTKEVGRYLPQKGRLAVFLSEDFPHQVIPANRQRHSIAGWFRINNSVSGVIDPTH